MDTTILKKICHYCAYQERSHQEVRYKLVELGIRGLELEEIMVYLIENNFLNEERYAQMFARGKHYVKKWGRLKITYQLKSKGISNYCIQKGLKEIEPNIYFDNARKLILQKLKDYQKYATPIAQQKAFQFMIGKGYETNIIREILTDIT